MGTSINIQVTGFVGSDPQVKTVGEQQVASFSVAVNRKNGNGKKQTLWLRVNCWNKLADVAAQYV
ncbi:MAG: single-stranded DNA-binding protein, partial [Anaerolineae bacterium]|nr:single-stranded DNA-binding protein [Anaerolineae bacterium]